MTVGDPSCEDDAYWISTSPLTTIGPWDDGHVPETSTAPTRLVQYPALWLMKEQEIEPVVVDDAVEEQWRTILYECTMNHATTSWGSYVPMDSIRQECGRITGSFCDNTQISQAICAVAATFWQHVVDHFHADDAQAHGVAVWALRSTVGASVPYHLDYAEQIRYDSNIIVPPLYAGTWHGVPDSDGYVGGDYCVHLNGLDHYQQHGYKGKLSRSGAGATQQLDDDNYFRAEWALPTKWRRLPYRPNRMILQLGHLPHYSTMVQAVPAGQCRIILGFNVYAAPAGAWVERLPEHSPAFCRKVALQRATWGQRPQQTEQGKQENTMTTRDWIRAHPKLAARLVRVHRRQTLQEHQAQLQADLMQLLLGNKVLLARQCQEQLFPQYQPEQVLVQLKRAIRQGLVIVLHGDDEPCDWAAWLDEETAPRCMVSLAQTCAPPLPS
jgi:hypothetical protein